MAKNSQVNFLNHLKCQTFFFLSGDSAKKQSLIFEAVDYGLKAIEIDEFNSEAHKWYAIVIGSRGEYLGIKEKILDGYEFKKHI